MKLKSLPSIYIPPRQTFSHLLVCLHGAGGKMTDYEELDEVIGIPRLAYLYLNAPYRHYGGYSWYAPSVSLKEGLAAASQMFGDVLDEIEAQGYPPSRTFLMGFSQGAQLIIHRAFHDYRRYAGYILISGQVLDLPEILRVAPGSAASMAPWLITHGVKDQILSIDVARTQVQSLREARVTDIEYHEFAKEHRFEAAEELPYVGQWIRRHM